MAGMENLVILDIGSNSVRMAINQIQADGSYREVKRMKNASRLSEKMGQQKVLQKKAIERTIDALADFQAVYTQFTHTSVIAIATAAVRQAKNQSAFLQEVKQRIGVDVKVLTSQQEAYYDYLGVMNRLGIQNCLILDIGGASCELIQVDNGQAVHLTSVPVGAVNITEKYRLNGTISGANLFNAEFGLRKLFGRIKWLHRAHHEPLVLLGGASRTLARINRRRQHMSRVDAIHGYHLSAEQVNRTFLNLLRGNEHRRKEIPGLEADRADIIVGGMLPLITVMGLTDVKKMYFSESGVREGIITEYLNNHYSKKHK